MRTGKLENGLINNLFQVIYDSGELLEATTDLTIDNLLGNTDEEYILIYRLLSESDNTGYYLTFNSDTGANYGSQNLYGSLTEAASVRYTDDTYFSGISLACYGLANDNGNICFGQLSLHAKSGKIRTGLQKTVSGIEYPTTVKGITESGFVWNNTADEITSITISAVSDATGVLGVGSRVILLKKVKLTTGLKTGDLNVQGNVKNSWEKIYETTLTSEAPDLVITGLAGNTDQIYRITCRIVDGSTTTVPTFYFYFNSDGTSSDFGYQYLKAVNTALSAVRDSDFPRIGLSQTANNDDKSYAECLLYVKAGYIRSFISSFMAGVSDVTINDINLWGASFNNTADEITILNIESSVADGLGIGTYI